MIYITRHGQTDWNVLKKVMGKCDEPLNQKGIEQANITKDRVKDISFDLIICSPLLRAKQTAKIISQSKNVEIIYDDRISERNFGEFEGLKTSEFDFLGYWDYYKNEHYKKAENIQDFFERIYTFLNHITAKYEDKNVLLVTHGGVSVAVACYFNSTIPTGSLIDAGLVLGNCEIACYKKTQEVKVDNEYSKLKSVVVASAAYFDPSNLALNNETIKYYASSGEVPTKEAILSEQANFWNELEKHDIKLLIAKQVEAAKGQMFTRDLAFVIGEKLFISNMKKENRKLAITGWDEIISNIDPTEIIKVPSDIYLEGGDVIVDNKTVYVGISERTTKEAITFLKENLGAEYTVLPLKLQPKYLHLDVVFTIINPNLALIYKDGLTKESYNLLAEFTKIEVTSEEQFELATNVFVLDSKTVIVNKNHQRIIQELKELGYTIIPIDFSETAKDGGAFRCTTCPIERG